MLVKNNTDLKINPLGKNLINPLGKNLIDSLGNIPIGSEKSRCIRENTANTDLQFLLNYLAKIGVLNCKASTQIAPTEIIYRPISNTSNNFGGYSSQGDGSSTIKIASNASDLSSSSLSGLQSGVHNELVGLRHAPFDSFSNWFTGLSDVNREKIITSLLELQAANGVSNQEFATSVQLISTAFLQLVKGAPHLEKQFEIIEKAETINAALFGWKSIISFRDSFAQMVDLLSNLEVGQGCSLFRAIQISVDRRSHAVRILFKRTENGLTVSLMNTGYGAVRLGSNMVECKRFELPRDLLAKPLMSKCLDGLLKMSCKTAAGTYEEGELNRQFRAVFNALVPTLQSDKGGIRKQTGGSCTFASWSRALDGIVGEDVAQTLRTVLLSQIHQQIKGTPVGDQYCHQIRQATELDVRQLVRSQIETDNDELLVEGSDGLSGTDITSIPQGLDVGGSLVGLSNTEITSIPQGLDVGGCLDLARCIGLTEIP